MHTITSISGCLLLLETSKFALDISRKSLPIVIKGFPKVIHLTLCSELGKFCEFQPCVQTAIYLVIRLINTCHNV